MMVETTDGFKEKVNRESTELWFQPFWTENLTLSDDITADKGKIFHALVGGYSDEWSGSWPNRLHTYFPLYFTVKLIIKNPKLWEKLK